MMNKWRLIEMARSYWTMRGEYANENEARDALERRIKEKEYAQRMRKGRTNKSAIRAMIECVDWNKDAYPDTVANRIRRMKDGMAV